MYWARLPQFRNEILDTEIYAEAAARRIGWHTHSDQSWEALRAERESPAPDQQFDLLDPSRMITQNAAPAQPAYAQKTIADQLA
jgi:phage terminase large subunit GpA-like protein